MHNQAMTHNFDITGLINARRGEQYELHDKHLNSAFVRMLKTLGFDVDFQRGAGSYLFDRAGNKYLDLLSGFGVFAIGRNHPTVISALEQTMHAELANLVQLDVSILSGLLAEELLKRVPSMERVFFCNSGTEAVESAIKFCRTATGRNKIIYCDHAFHGLTYGALSLNGEQIFRQGFGDMLADCDSIPYNDLVALEAKLKSGDVAAFIVEPLQGKNVKIPDDNYLPEAARLCRKYGALFVADEIQTGIGRTGKFLAIEHWNVEPDLVLIAKALSGGFVPVGAVLTKKWIYAKLFDRMDRSVVHGSTFGKNDLAMAAGLATLAVLDQENLIQKAAQQGETLMAMLREIMKSSDFLKDVRGKGLMIGLEFGRPKSLALQAGWHLIEAANTGLFCQLVLVPLFKQHRMLCQVAGYKSHVIKLIPALNLGPDDLTWIRDGFTRTILDCQNMGGAVWGLVRDLAKHALKAKAG